MDMTEKTACGATGFYLSGSLAPEATKKAISACDQALRHFPWLERKRLQHGAVQFELWGHHDPDESTYLDRSGNLLILVGSPMNVVSWEFALEQLARQGDDVFELPWEGRCILIRLSPGGKDWTMWNDWCGSIPVFHTSVKGVPAASSLEPPVVAAAGFTPDDFSKRGIVEMLVHGHFLGTDTLFAEMQTLPPDSVSRWREGKFVGSNVLWTVEPCDSRWDRGWDELADEMHEHTVRAVGYALRQHDKWILPLSGGMDSRLIACVGADQGVDFQAYTYGPATWNEPIYARQVARALDIPWQRVDVGTDYLADYTPLWLDWFGSSLHAHGMYQMPFLQAVREIDAPILQGLMGDPLAGNHLKGLYRSGSTPYEHLCDFETLWSVEETASLLTFNVDKVLSDISDSVQTQFELLQGAEYQRQMFIDFWNRQRNFIFYQPMMYDYWKGVSTPYMNREYARFCLSLPRLALEERRLQKEMLERYYPKMAIVGGTFGGPLLKGKPYYVKRVIAGVLPRSLRVGPLKEFAATANTIQTDALRALGEQALWPLNEVRQDLGALLDLRSLESSYQQAAAGDEKAYNRMRPIQSIAWHYVES